MEYPGLRKATLDQAYIVQYRIYTGPTKAILDSAYADSNVAFLRPGYTD